MIWLYSVKYVTRLELENEMLKAENQKLIHRLAAGEFNEMFVDTEDPEGDKKFEKLKKDASKDNRKEGKEAKVIYDNFSSDSLERDNA